MGAFSTLFVLTALRDAALLIAMTIVAWAGVDLPIGAIARDTAVTVPLLTLLITALGYVNARRVARVRDVDVPIVALPAALHGFTIVQISDVHVGPRSAATTSGDRRVGERARCRRRGDHRRPRRRKRPPVGVAYRAARASRVAARHVFRLGNHEYYSGVRAWMTELRRLGLNILVNEHVVLEHGARRWCSQASPISARTITTKRIRRPRCRIGGAPGDAGAKVLLAHQPRSAIAAARAGFDLQLSGHTHGGQFLPWNFFVRFQQPFTAGLARLGALWVYTSRGTGWWGPPKRFGAPSEITRVRLVTA
jgi:predicted MPP superfamily phosphohydrolase